MHLPEIKIVYLDYNIPEICSRSSKKSNRVHDNSAYTSKKLCIRFVLFFSLLVCFVFQNSYYQQCSQFLVVNFGTSDLVTRSRKNEFGKHLFVKIETLRALSARSTELRMGLLCSHAICDYYLLSGLIYFLCPAPGDILRIRDLTIREIMNILYCTY